MMKKYQVLLFTSLITKRYIPTHFGFLERIISAIWSLRVVLDETMAVILELYKSPFFIILI